MTHATSHDQSIKYFTDSSKSDRGSGCAAVGEFNTYSAKLYIEFYC